MSSEQLRLRFVSKRGRERDVDAGHLNKASSISRSARKRYPKDCPKPSVAGAASIAGDLPLTGLPGVKIKLQFILICY